jgi:hypothetical protein
VAALSAVISTSGDRDSVAIKAVSGEEVMLRVERVDSFDLTAALIFQSLERFEYPQRPSKMQTDRKLLS